MGQIIGVIVILGLGISILGALIYVGMRENSGADPLQARLAEYADRECRFPSGIVWLCR